MLDMAVRFENPIRKNAEYPAYDICSMIKVSGVLSGCIVLSYPTEMAIQVASEMLNERLTKINANTIDAISEIINMVSGVADTELGMDDISYSLPNVVMNKHEIFYPKDSFIFSMPCLLDSGAFEIDIALSELTQTYNA